MDNIALKLGIKSPREWANTPGTVVSQSGASGVLVQYQNSLWRALSAIYPGS